MLFLAQDLETTIKLTFYVKLANSTCLQSSFKMLSVLLNPRSQVLVSLYKFCNSIIYFMAVRLKLTLLCRQSTEPMHPFVLRYPEFYIRPALSAESNIFFLCTKRSFLTYRYISRLLTLVIILHFQASSPFITDSISLYQI